MTSDIYCSWLPCCICWSTIMYSIRPSSHVINFTDRVDVKQLSEVIWQKAASLSCHPSWRRMHSSPTCAGQAYLPAAAGGHCGMHSRVGTLQWAGTMHLGDNSSIDIDMDDGCKVGERRWEGLLLAVTVYLKIIPKICTFCKRRRGTAATPASKSVFILHSSWEWCGMNCVATVQPTSRCV